jgi:hypothetical protein
MARRKLPYKEGDWFSVPLRNGGFAVGLIARARRTGKILFGYFWGPKRDQLPKSEELQHLQPQEAVFMCRFGDLGLMNRKWEIIESSQVWQRGNWPMPPFVREDCISGKKKKIYYAEDDPGCEITKESCNQDCLLLPEDSLYGYGAVEIVLTEILSP